MNRFEKFFVNASSRSRSVSRTVARRFETIPLPAGTSVLDVGCGNGAAALHLADRYGFRVAGVDVDPEQIAAARIAAAEREDARFDVADVGALPFGDGTFDAVTTNMTLHHVPAWRSGLAEIARVLRPGGFLVYGDLVVPAWLSPLFRRLFGARAGVLTATELDQCLDRFGYIVIYRRTRWIHYEAVARASEIPA